MLKSGTRDKMYLAGLDCTLPLQGTFWLQLKPSGACIETKKVRKWDLTISRLDACLHHC